MTGFFHGTATAMVTPFADGNVNFEAFGRMIEYQIAGGTDVLLVLGTTGEPATMTDAEKEAVMRFAVQKVAGRAKIVFGSGSNSTAKAIEASKKAEALGADGLLVVTPYYNKCTQNGIYEHYKAICEAVSVPVIAYNVPARTGVNILPATAERLAGIPNLAGIKEACGNMEQICETARRIRGKCDLYSGDDNLNLPILAIGFAIAHGFGLGQEMATYLEQQINNPTVTKYIFEFSRNALKDTKVGIITGVGVFVLLFSVIKMICDIEKAFNFIWGGQTNRPLLVKASY